MMAIKRQVPPQVCHKMLLCFYAEHFTHLLCYLGQFSCTPRCYHGHNNTALRKGNKFVQLTGIMGNPGLVPTPPIPGYGGTGGGGGQSQNLERDMPRPRPMP